MAKPGAGNSHRAKYNCLPPPGARCAVGSEKGVSAKYRSMAGQERSHPADGLLFYRADVADKRPRPEKRREFSENCAQLIDGNGENDQLLLRRFLKRHPGDPPIGPDSKLRIMDRDAKVFFQISGCESSESSISDDRELFLHASFWIDRACSKTAWKILRTNSASRLASRASASLFLIMSRSRPGSGIGIRRLFFQRPPSRTSSWRWPRRSISMSSMKSISFRIDPTEVAPLRSDCRVR